MFNLLKNKSTDVKIIDINEKSDLFGETLMMVYNSKKIKLNYILSENSNIQLSFMYIVTKYFDSKKHKLNKIENIFVNKISFQKIDNIIENMQVYNFNYVLRYYFS